MDRKKSSRSFDQGAMCTRRITQGQPLLPSRPGRCVQFHTHATHRRDLHRKALQRLQSDRSEITQGRVPSQPQTSPGAHAGAWGGGDATRTQHIQEPSGTSQISLSFTWPFNSAAIGGLEHGHHVHPLAGWLCLPYSGYRLVQPLSSCISPLKQPRRRILLGGFRRGHRKVRKAQNLQHRPRRAVFFTPICPCYIEQRDSIQHGRTRKGARQHFCGAPMAICKIRGRVPA